MGKWNIVSNLIIMLSKDVHALKAQLSDLGRQEHITQKTLKSLKTSCRTKQGKYFSDSYDNKFNTDLEKMFIRKKVVAWNT